MSRLVCWLLTLAVVAACAVETFEPAVDLADAKGAPNALAWDTMLVVPIDTTVAAGAAVQLCGFPVFRNGVVGLATVDAVRCAAAYAALPDSLKGVNRKQQAILDALGPVTWTIE
jgi:hypothetical protein